MTGFDSISATRIRTDGALRAGQTEDVDDFTRASVHHARTTTLTDAGLTFRKN